MVSRAAANAYHREIEKTDGDDLAISQLARKRQNLLIPRLRGVKVSLNATELRQCVERGRDFTLVAKLLRQGQGLLQMPARGGNVPFAKAGQSERLENCGDARLIADLARNRQAFLEIAPGFAVVAHKTGELTCIDQRPGPGGIALLRSGARQRLDHRPET